jgi:hypothetical protein
LPWTPLLRTWMRRPACGVLFIPYIEIMRARVRARETGAL